MAQNIVPSVDLNQFVQGNAAEKQAFVNAIGKAYEEVGFVSVKNHGIDEALVTSFYKEVNSFFAMEERTKRKYEIEGLAGQRGYTAFGKEQAKDSNVADLKEFWQFGQIVEGEDKVASQYPKNIEVQELPSFNRAGEKLFKSFEKSGKHLLSAIALYLDLDEAYFNSKIYNGNSILRAIHYPPITKEPESAIRAEQHEDINLITLLVGASADGLQLLNKQNEWIPVAVPTGHIVVNVGDMLQRHTNNRLRSTTHRVVNPPKSEWHKPRLSIPFFLHPRSEMDLSCLGSCVTQDNPKQYEPITAGEYLTQRLIEIGLLKR